MPETELLVPANFYVLLSFVLFSIGVAGVLLRRNAIIIFMSIELMLNSTMLNAPFLAMVQITVYAGAIMVLFLFVIMLLGGEQVPLAGSQLRWQTPLGVLLVLGLLAAAVYATATGEMGSVPELAEEAENFGGPFHIGEVLFSRYLFPFELTSVLLLVAMIGAVVLTKDVTDADEPKRVRKGPAAAEMEGQ